MSEDKEVYDIDQMFKNSRSQQVGSNLVVGVGGDTETGKTYLALDFPGPIRVINLDYGLRENLGYYKDKEVTDFKPTSFVTPEMDIENYKWDKANPEQSLKKVEAALTALIDTQHGGTVIIDSMTTINDWLKLMLDYKTDKEGKQTDGKIAIFDWKYVNQKWKWLWQLIKSIDANVVCIYRTKDVYENFKKTGEEEFDYRDGTKYEVSIEIHLTKEVDTDSDGKPVVKRFATFNKFRGVKLSKQYRIENLTHSRLVEILKDEGKI